MQVVYFFSFILSAEGDSFEFHSNFGHTVPEEIAAKNCKTHKEVLSFLYELNASKIKTQIDFQHCHNIHHLTHMGRWPADHIHPCSLEKQIEFVANKINNLKPLRRLSFLSRK